MEESQFNGIVLQVFRITHYLDKQANAVKINIFSKSLNEVRCAINRNPFNLFLILFFIFNLSSFKNMHNISIAT